MKFCMVGVEGERHQIQRSPFDGRCHYSSRYGRDFGPSVVAANLGRRCEWNDQENSVSLGSAIVRDY